MVLVAAPWMFLASAVAYAYLPTQLAAVTGRWGLVYATATTVVALGVSSAIQPLARRVHSLESARGVAIAVLVMTVGLAVVTIAIAVQSVWIGLAANVITGAGIGVGLVSALLEVQQIATVKDLAGLTGVFYAGFLA